MSNAYQSTQKKVIQQTVAVDYDTGEVKQETNLLRIPQEPAFIKLYLDDILYYHDMPRGLNPILQIFLRNMNWENRLILNGSLKKRMAESIKLSVASIDKAITQLVKGDILIREEKGIYLFNPYLFGKGSWEAIQEIRFNITYNLSGRTFSSKIKTEAENGQTNDTESTTEQPADVFVK
jgi:hypothetical protein